MYIRLMRTGLDNAWRYCLSKCVLPSLSGPTCSSPSGRRCNYLRNLCAAPALGLGKAQTLTAYQIRRLATDGMNCAVKAQRA
jgi:hypothetical protein